MCLRNLSSYDAASFHSKPDYSNINGDGVMLFRGKYFLRLKIRMTYNKGGLNYNFNNINKTKRCFPMAGKDNKN